MRNSKSLLACTAALLLALACLPAWANTCRVTTDGLLTNDGSTWALPISLQGALTTAACTEIWVAKGVYKPTSAADRTISFNILPGIAVYGGFAGTESLLTDRTDIAGNPTVLSGDIDNNDTNTDGVDLIVDSVNNGGNSYTVVVMDGTTGAGGVEASTKLDGFIVTAGNNDNVVTGYGFGGGFFCNGTGSGACNPTLSNVTFSGNSAQAGGAMYNWGGNGGTSSPTLSKVTFSGNSAVNDGGAMYNAGGFGGTSNPTLGNVTFSGNSATNGGAMVNLGYLGVSNPALSNVTFSGNTATGSGSCGGALYNFFSFPTLKNIIVWGNTSIGNTSANAQICNANSGPPNTGTPTYTSCVVEGSGGSGAWNSNWGTDNGGNIDADPKLGPLQDNGGSTQTMLPGAGSSAIDHGDAATCSAAPVSGLDQRGITRPRGPACDIGAVELLTPDRIFADNFDGTPPVQ